MVVQYAGAGGPIAGGSAHRKPRSTARSMSGRSQVATGDRGVFDMNSEVLVLSGDRVVLSG